MSIWYSIASSFSARAELGDLPHELAEVEPPPVGRLLARGAVGQGRLAELDRPVERRDQARGEALRERIGNCRQAVGNELRRRQHVAQVVIDARDRHAELGKTLALREFVGQRTLHRRQRGFGSADLVVTSARGDHARDVLRVFAEGDDVGGEPAHRPQHHLPQGRPEHAGDDRRDHQRDVEKGVRHPP